MDITTAAQDALNFLVQNGQQVSQQFAAAERYVWSFVLLLGAQMLQLHLAREAHGYEGSSRACDCGADQRFVAHRQRTLATTLGSVQYRRAYYHCRECGQSCCPYDQECGLDSRQMSCELASKATLLAVHDPFASSSQILQRLSGQHLAEATIQRSTLKVGGRAAEAEKQLALRMASWSVPQALASPRRLYVAVDAAFIHLEDGWHDVKCVVCWWEDEPGRVHKRGMTRRATAEEFKAFVWGLACQCGLQTADEVVLLGDGAAWIWDQVGGILGEKTICITDWYHVTEHLWACGKALHGEGTEAAKSWEQQLETMLWKGKSAALLKRLHQEQKNHRGRKREAIESLITYLENQGDRLRFAEFRKRGLDIGSGRVEAACKQVGVRMKRNGMRWSEEGAQAVLSLRSVWLNGDWDKFWDQRPLAE